MDIRNTVTQEVIELELFHTYRLIGGVKQYCYETEGYDKKKIETEGSAWIVYTYDCMKDYYNRNKKRIDREVTRILRTS